MNLFREQTIIVPVDLSEFSIAAVRDAVELAGDAKNVRVVHVIAPIIPPEPGFVWAHVDDDARSAHAMMMLSGYLADAGLDDIDKIVRFGRTAEQIVEVASEHDAKLIVISSHGRSGFKRFVLGSVAEGVLRLADCRVLVVKPSEVG